MAEIALPPAGGGRRLARLAGPMRVISSLKISEPHRTPSNTFASAGPFQL
jgi:hypothetical protein